MLMFSFLLGEVLFNAQYPEDPPDFIFAPEDREFVPDIGNLPVSIWLITCNMCFLQEET